MQKSTSLPLTTKKNRYTYKEVYVKRVGFVDWPNFWLLIVDFLWSVQPVLVCYGSLQKVWPKLWHMLKKLLGPPQQNDEHVTSRMNHFIRASQGLGNMKFDLNSHIILVTFPNKKPLQCFVLRILPMLFLCCIMVDRNIMHLNSQVDILQVTRSGLYTNLLVFEDYRLKEWTPLLRLSTKLCSCLKMNWNISFDRETPFNMS